MLGERIVCRMHTDTLHPLRVPPIEAQKKPGVVSAGLSVSLAARSYQGLLPVGKGQAA